MANTVEWIENVQADYQAVPLLAHLTPAIAEEILAYHRTWPEYRETPVHSLPRLAAYAGVRSIYVKDEAERFGIHSFKILGGTWAVARALAERWRLLEGPVSASSLKAAASWAPAVTLAAASDGNHGMGVAWTARELGQRAAIFLPAGTRPSRVDRIAALGAEVHVTDMNYDATVKHAAQQAAEHGWLLIQDTSWPGYEQIPRWVTQGYLSMALEAFQQLDVQGMEPPTHVILQAGVGSLAAAVTGFYANRYGAANCPTILIAEPTLAPALLESARRSDGQLAKIGGPMDTVMAGLACGEPNPLAWPLLRSWASFFVACSDSVAARGTRILSNPLGDDARILSGESGSMPVGLLVSLMDDPRYHKAREAFRLTSQSRILLFNTEGIPDPGLFLDIVWNGGYCAEPK